MTTINDLNLNEIPELGNCPICLDDEPKTLYSHLDKHPADSAICRACAESLKPPRCPFCREDLVKKISVSSPKEDDQEVLISLFLTMYCKQPSPFWGSQNDRGPPPAGSPTPFERQPPMVTV